MKTALRKKLLLIAIVLILIASLFMTACGKDSTGGNNGISSTEFKVGYDDQPFYLSRSTMTVTDGNGNYMFYAGVLYYYDNASDKTVIVCNKPDCEHINNVDDSECNAFFPESKFYIYNGIAFYDNSIYLLGQSGDGNKTSVSLYKVSKDGVQREEVCKLFSTSDINMVGFFTVHRGYAFWSLFPEGSAQLYSMKLDDPGNINTVYEGEGLAPDILAIAGSGDYMYFKYRDATDKTYEKFDCTLYRTKLGSGSVEELTKCGDGFTVMGNTAFYISENKYLCAFDLNTREESKIYKLTNEEKLIVSDGKYIYLSNWDNAENEKDYKIVVLSPSGDVVDTINTPDCNFFIGGDFRNLFITTNGWKIDVLDKASLGTGNHNWDIFFRVEDDGTVILN